MLDSPGLTIAVRRSPPNVEDLRSIVVDDDPIQRRDMILIERAKAGELDGFNDLVTCYQDHLFALVARMVPDRDQAAHRFVLQRNGRASQGLRSSRSRPKRTPSTHSPWRS